jgi:hypothetical protein
MPQTRQRGSWPRPLRYVWVAVALSALVILADPLSLPE